MDDMFILVAALAVYSAPNDGVIPKPVSCTWSNSAPFEFTKDTKLVSDCKATHFLKDMLHRAAGINLNGNGKQTRVVFHQLSDSSRLKPDWYTLKIDKHELKVEYSSEGGAFYAVETLRQMLPDEIENDVVTKDMAWSLPACEITDGPRFQWRGMLLDCSRHFFPVSFIKKTIDRLAMMKMNVFHWHLVDDGGWRLEIKKYPKLTQFGAWRLDTGEVWPGGRWNYGNIQFVGQTSKQKKYGGFYTQEEVKDVVKYAADRHVTIVPEIELPGHSLGAVVSYPELLCNNVPAADKPGKSVSNVYCAGSDAAIKFLEDVLDETMSLFPSKFIHIGADEVLKDYWHNCDRCQARMKSEGLKTEAELQSWMVRHFDTYLANHGRRLVGWDEILEGGLAEGATVMSWRGIDGGIAAAKAGRDVVMTPTSHCYFDYSYQSITTENVYGWNPVPETLSTQESSHILGGQYNVWAEHIATEQRCEEMQFPRALAMAEVLWSSSSGRDFKEYSAREAKMLKRLDRMGVTYHLPSPSVQYSSVFFESQTTIKAENPKGIPFKLRYTIDGSLPDGKSPLYENGVKMDKPGRLTFAYVNSSGVSGEPATVDCRQFKNTDQPLKPGLVVYKYLLSGEPSQLPDLKKLQPSAQGAAQDLLEAERPRERQFAVAWDGYIKIPTTGAYTFSLTSDDGSRLWLEDALVVDNDGPHGAVEKPGTAWLPKGTYRFYCAWFDQGGANSFKATLSGPGFKEGPIPASLLFNSKN